MRTKPNNYVHDGFSLVELMLATALGALLLIGVMKVMASVSSTQTGASAKPHGGTPLEKSVAWLERDLENAHYATLPGFDRPKRLTLLGPMAIEFSGLQRGRASLEPAEVIYRVEEVDGQHCLFRQQRILPIGADPEGPPSIARELLLVGIANWEVRGRSSIPFTTDVSGRGRADELPRNPEEPSLSESVGPQDEDDFARKSIPGGETSGESFWEKAKAEDPLRVWSSMDERPTQVRLRLVMDDPELPRIDRLLLLESVR